MRKYAFMVYHKEYDSFLHTLRDLGVVHVKTTKSIAGDANLQEIIGQRKRIGALTDFLRRLNRESGNEQLSEAVKTSREEGIRLVEKIENLQEKKTHLMAERQTLRKDIDYMDIWGEFSYITIENLKEAGYAVSFFSCPTSRFDTQWVDRYNAFLVNNIQSVSYFVTVTKEGEPIEIEAERSKMPDRSLDVLRSDFTRLEENIVNINRKLNEMAASEYNTLDALDKSLQDEFNFSNVIVQTERQADDKIMFLEGWTTEPQAASMEAGLDKQGYFFQQTEILEGDKIPIQLKNNRYARLFEPITKMFSLPNYTELDPTPLLAPFFMLFFGLCFGDAGYGLLVLVVAGILKTKLSPDIRPVLSLAQWLGGTAVVVGSMTGTLFGVELVHVEAFKAVKDYFMTQDNMMTLSIILGLIHIVYGKGVAAYKTKVQKGVKHSIAPWAWVFVIVALLMIFGLPVMDIMLPQAVIYACYGIAVLSGLIILLYNSPGKSIFVNFGAGLWSVYNAASGLLGDTLSYIRLFAIGLTGGILGSVFNMLAIDMTGSLPVAARIPIMLIILLVGHGLNMGLCTISSLVHPIRLIFVEYFKNSEYEGGGIAYVPFKKS